MCIFLILSSLPPGEPYCSVQFYIVPVTWDLHKYTLKVRRDLTSPPTSLSHFTLSPLSTFAKILTSGEKQTVKVIGALGVCGDFWSYSLFLYFFFFLFGR